MYNLGLIFRLIYIKAIAITDSGINQGVINSNRDGGIGVMQLTRSTLTTAANLLSVTKSKLTENSDADASLNILGSAAVLKSFMWWASPMVTGNSQYNLCSQNNGNYFTCDHIPTA